MHARFGKENLKKQINWKTQTQMGNNTDIKKIGRKDMNWIDMAQDRES